MSARVDKSAEASWPRTNILKHRNLIVLRNLRKASDQVARRYNAGRKATPFRVGDVVIYRVKVLSSKGKGVSAKLGLTWSKPMVIAKFLKTNVVQLANAETGVVLRKAHVCQLKGYH